MLPDATEPEPAAKEEPPDAVALVPKAEEEATALAF